MQLFYSICFLNVVHLILARKPLELTGGNRVLGGCDSGTISHMLEISIYIPQPASSKISK